MTDAALEDNRNWSTPTHFKLKLLKQKNKYSQYLIKISKWIWFSLFPRFPLKNSLPLATSVITSSITTELDHQ